MKALLPVVMSCLVPFHLKAQANSPNGVHASEHQHSAAQHGFVIANDGAFASHLVAGGQHSFQANLDGELVFLDQESAARYEESVKEHSSTHYFLLQAQGLRPRDLKVGTVLEGHIVMIPNGTYDPTNTIVDKAQFKTGQVRLYLRNPFFGSGD